MEKLQKYNICGMIDATPLPQLLSEHGRDVGGKYGSEWVVVASSWRTAIYTPPGKLPRTGFKDIKT